MRTRPIDARRAYRCLGLATAAMLTVALAASDAAQAQERAAAGGQAGTPAVVAAVQRIDPSYLDLNQPGGRGLQYLEDGTPNSEADTSQNTDIGDDQATDPVTVDSVTVGANVADPGPWDGFRTSVAGAATSSCLDPEAPSHEQFAVQGLLRLPFLVRAASAGACR